MRVRLIEVGLALLLLRCAPLMTMQAPMATGGDYELGIGGGVSQRFHSDCTGCVLPDPIPDTGATGQVWYRRQFGHGFRLGAVISVGHALASAGGLRAEWDAYSSEDLRFSINAECGWYWCTVGLPLAYRTGGGLWLYGGPFAGATLGGVLEAHPIFRLPVGFAIPVGDHNLLLGEVSAVYRPSFAQGGTYLQDTVLFVAGVGFATRM